MKFLAKISHDVRKANEKWCHVSPQPFQNIGKGIFHFSLIFDIGQVWSFWRHKAVFLVYNIIDIEENRAEWASFKQ